MVLSTSPVGTEGPAVLRRSWLRLAFLIVLSGALSGGCKKADNNALRWGADEEGGAPYISKDLKNDKFVGFEVELIEALSREIGRPIEHQHCEFKNLYKDLERKDIDLAMNGLEVIPEREKEVRFSRPYYIYRLQLVARKDAAFTSLKDLEGKDVKVGTLINTAASRLLEKLKIPAVLFDDQVNPYRKLAEGELDAVLLDLPIAIYVVKKNAELNDKLKFVGAAVAPGRYAIAFRKQDEELARKFDDALGRLIKNGELKRIYEKWELWNDDQKLLDDPDGASKTLESLTTALGR